MEDKYLKERIILKTSHLSNDRVSFFFFATSKKRPYPVVASQCNCGVKYFLMTERSKYIAPDSSCYPCKT